mmetsp:Transcript_16736/g.25981  ORF Transcript_16736/g.25981 Transcript_16736/m.25981 type:complete len:201 (-) Transcript_16736:225-827(-)
MYQRERLQLVIHKHWFSVRFMHRPSVRKRRKSLHQFILAFERGIRIQHWRFPSGNNRLFLHLRFRNHCCRKYSGIGGLRSSHLAIISGGDVLCRDMQDRICSPSTQCTSSRIILSRGNWSLSHWELGRRSRSRSHGSLWEATLLSCIDRILGVFELSVPFSAAGIQILLDILQLLFEVHNSFLLASHRLFVMVEDLLLLV